jgi:hypothetical protein
MVNVVVIVFVIAIASLLAVATSMLAIYSLFRLLGVRPRRPSPQSFQEAADAA